MENADPIRATFVAILKQLNQAESRHEGKAPDQSLELAEVERRLADFWAIRDGRVQVRFALGLLLRNGLVQANRLTDYSWQRQRTVQLRYAITAAGKQFLVGALERSDRVG
jgi:hypothetical protein